MKTYWPPASGNMPPNSAHASPASSVTAPATTHSRSAKRGSGTACSTSAGVMKMEAPMVPLTTSMTESNRVRRRTSASTRIFGLLAIEHPHDGRQMLLGVRVEHRHLIGKSLRDRLLDPAQRAVRGHGQQLPLAGLLQVVEPIEGGGHRGPHHDRAMIAHHEHVLVAQDACLALPFAYRKGGALTVLVVGDFAEELQPGERDRFHHRA